MQYYSSKNKNILVSFKQAIFDGLPLDGGLYLPVNIPLLDREFINNIKSFDFRQMAFEIISKYTGNEIPEMELKEIIDESFNFQIPLKKLDENFYIMELFHGPTLAFKDFGARFLAGVMGYFVKNDFKKKLNILVATSGDTGSAVANAFYNVSDITVTILFPKDKVSKLQEVQLTSYGGNINAVEINGTFDDCQHLVKTAFLDEELKRNFTLSSANSINIARLIPQSLYYFEAVKMLDNDPSIIFSVPSGNLGNLTGGVLAKKMGLPVKSFIGATNSNSGFTEFIKTGSFIPRRSVLTISNAMDVGNPSNFERVKNIYLNFDEICSNIDSFSFNDEETKLEIKRIYEKYNYIIDPHGAVATLAANRINKNNKTISLLTAHPAKFYNTVKNIIGEDFTIPEELQKSMKRKQFKIICSSTYSEFKKTFIDING